MEAIRKEHQKEIERIKNDNGSELKNFILLLQRQNVNLESKAERIQAHLKTMEGNLKELMATIEVKNKVIADKDANRQKSEALYQVKV